ncbi:hypothetical protein ACFWXK_22620 [Streptomyces sp. NPDC059070]|uniref:hypothetical protein n=1 Tax=Streptomyces sp. NPDC059070 TaxID=3346713 RepID=UPI0036C688A0
MKVVFKAKGQKGFKVLPRMWRIERTISWWMHSRRLVRDYERLPQHSEALINWSAITLMTRRLTRKPARRDRPTTPVITHWDEVAA